MKGRAVRLLRKARVARLKARVKQLEAHAALLTEQRDEATARWAELENALNWQTTCLGCAKALDGSIAEYERADQAEELNRRYEDLLAYVVLHINWRFVTGQLTTEQKELFADAVDRDAFRNHGPDGEDPDPEMARPTSVRWWRPDFPQPVESLPGSFSEDPWKGEGRS